VNTTSPSTDAPAPPGTRPGQRQRRRVPVRATLLVLVLAAVSLAVVVAGRGPRFGPPPPLLAVPLDESGQRDGAVDGRSAESDGSPGEARLWMSHEHLRSLPMEGPAWDAVAQAAEQPLDGRRANLAHRNLHASQTFATALVAARTDSDRDRARVRDALRDVVAQEPDRDDVLAAARRLGTYVVAADVIELSRFDPAFDRDFREWLRAMLAFRYAAGGGGGTLVEVHERRANNFGTHAGASRVAAAAYLGDDAELARAATVFKGWLGDRDSYTGFVFGRGSWQHDPRRPVGINPVGAERDGHSIDGVLPDDQRRSGRFRWPPKRENYVWGALQGAVAQAHLLARQGYAAWAWEDEALRRALTWLHVEADYPAEGDDVWVVPLANAAYGTRFEVAEPGASESYGFTAWTHPAADGRP
jgi:hypothetical protein